MLCLHSSNAMIKAPWQYHSNEHNFCKSIEMIAKKTHTHTRYDRRKIMHTPEQKKSNTERFSQWENRGREKKRYTRKEVSNITCSECNNTDSLIYLPLICSPSAVQCIANAHQTHAHTHIHFVDVISTLPFYFCVPFHSFRSIFHVLHFITISNDGCKHKRMNEQTGGRAVARAHSFIVIQNA